MSKGDNFEMNYRKFLLSFLFSSLFFFQLHCGGGEEGKIEFISDNLALVVSNTQSFNPNINHGKIIYYEITVTGPDLGKKFIKRFSTKTRRARVLGIPVGKSRTILVEAFNANGVVIRRAKKEGVAIEGAKLTQVQLAMDAVPIFTNVADKGLVRHAKTRLGIFGEPNSRLRIHEIDDEGDALEVWVNRSTHVAYVDTSSDEGLFYFDLPRVELGIHRFRVTDENTGESSTIQASFYADKMQPGWNFVSGGDLVDEGETRMMTSVGQFFWHPVWNSKNDFDNYSTSEVVSAVAQDP